MISKHDDIPCTIIPQSNTRCSVISAITMSEDDFMSRQQASPGNNDENDNNDDDDDDGDMEEIEASMIENMVMEMYNRTSAAISERTKGDGATSQHDRFGSFTGPTTSEFRQAMPKPERKPSVNILLSPTTSSSHGDHDTHFHRDSLPHHRHEIFDRVPSLPSRRPSESISHMQSHVSEQTERSTLVGFQSP